METMFLVSLPPHCGQSLAGVDWVASNSVIPKTTKRKKNDGTEVFMFVTKRGGRD